MLLEIAAPPLIKGAQPRTTGTIDEPIRDVKREENEAAPAALFLQHLPPLS